jgi:hypothetical protein
MSGQRQSFNQRLPYRGATRRRRRDQDLVCRGQKAIFGPAVSAGYGVLSDQQCEQLFRMLAAFFAAEPEDSYVSRGKCHTNAALPKIASALPMIAQYS